MARILRLSVTIIVYSLGHTLLLLGLTVRSAPIPAATSVSVSLRADLNLWRCMRWGSFKFSKCSENAWSDTRGWYNRHIPSRSRELQTGTCRIRTGTPSAPATLKPSSSSQRMSRFRLRLPLPFSRQPALSCALHVAIHILYCSLLIAKWRRLEGAVITRVLAPPEGRAFEFEVTFELGHGRLKALQDQKPPLHFHPYQQEYIEVLEGFICLEIEGQEELLDEASGELCIQPWTNHRLYPPTREMISGNNPFTAQKTVFLLSGSETDHPLKLDLSFFQNWYAYQDQIVIHRAQPSYLQLLSVSDERIFLDVICLAKKSISIMQ